MAVRIHVTATAASESDMRRVFGEVLGEAFANLSIESTGLWNFFTTSVWGVNSSHLFDGLKRLNVVGLQATTEDASRWYLTVFCPGRDPVTFLHDFHLFHGECNPEQTIDEPEPEEVDPRLAFLQPDPEPGLPHSWSQFDTVAQDYADMRVPIAGEFRESVAGLNYGEALLRFREYEVQRLVDVATNAGISFERSALADALLWKSVTPSEGDSDIGNLPRVLFALGLKGSIEDCIQQSELEQSELEKSRGSEIASDESHSEDIEPAADIDDDDYDPDEEVEMSDEDAKDIAATEAQVQHMIACQRTAEILATARKPFPRVTDEDSIIPKTLRAAQQVQPLPLAGGSVGLRMNELSLLDFFAKSVAVENSPPAVVRLDFPPSFSSENLVVKESYCIDLQSQRTPDGLLIGVRSLDVLDVPEPGEWNSDAVVEYFGDSIAAVLRSPASGTRISVCFADPQQPCTWLWFSGEVAAGLWLIDRTFPVMHQNKLAEAMELARAQQSHEYLLRDPAEADAVMEAASKDAYLYNMDVKRDGLQVRCDFDGMGFLAQLILQHRFCDVWNFRPAIDNAVTKYMERISMQRQMQRNLARMRRENAAPCDRSNVIYRGAASIYWAADIASWDKLDPQPRLDFEAAMARMQFMHVGDFVCKKLRDYVSSYYISPDQLSYGLILANRFGYAGFEFVSHFENDAHLTTSTSWLANSHPEIESYAQNHPDLNHDQLYERHQWGISRFRSHRQTVPVQLPGTLPALASLFDSMLVKMATVENGVIVEAIDIGGDDRSVDDD